MIKELENFRFPLYRKCLELELLLTDSKRKAKHKCCKCKKLATWCDCNEGHKQHFYCNECVPSTDKHFLHNSQGFKKRGNNYLIRIHEADFTNELLPSLELYFENSPKVETNAIYKQVNDIINNYSTPIENYSKFTFLVSKEIGYDEYKKIKHIFKRCRYAINRRDNFKKLL